MWLYEQSDCVKRKILSIFQKRLILISWTWFCSTKLQYVAVCMYPLICWTIPIPLMYSIRVSLVTNMDSMWYVWVLVMWFGMVIQGGNSGSRVYIYKDSSTYLQLNLNPKDFDCEECSRKKFIDVYGDSMVWWCIIS